MAIGSSGDPTQGSLDAGQLAPVTVYKTINMLSLTFVPGLIEPVRMLVAGDGLTLFMEVPENRQDLILRLD